MAGYPRDFYRIAQARHEFMPLEPFLFLRNRERLSHLLRQPLHTSPANAPAPSTGIGEEVALGGAQRLLLSNNEIDYEELKARDRSLPLQRNHDTAVR